MYAELRSIFMSSFYREGVLNVDGALGALGFAQLEALPSFSMRGHAEDLLARTERSGSVMNSFLLCCFHSMNGSCYLKWGDGNVWQKFVHACIMPGVNMDAKANKGEMVYFPSPHDIYNGAVDVGSAKVVANNPKLAVIVLLRFFRVDLMDLEKLLRGMLDNRAREAHAKAKAETLN